MKIVIVLLLLGLLILGFYTRYSTKAILKSVKNEVMSTPTYFMEYSENELKVTRHLILNKPGSGEKTTIKWSSILKADLLNGSIIEILPRTSDAFQISSEEFDMNEIRELALWLEEKVTCTEVLLQFCSDMKAQFKGCRFCGRIAVLDNQCVNCNHGSVEQELAERREYDDELVESTLLKEEQAFWFDDGEGNIDLDFDKDNVFEKDPNWKLEK